MSHRVADAPWFTALVTRSAGAVGFGVLPGHLRPGLLPQMTFARRELVDHIVAADVGVIVVTAPAGAGKTVLLCQWAERWPDERLGWLSLHGVHNDPARFWMSLVAATRTANPESTQVAALHRDAANGIDLARLLAAIDDGSRAALVIDDFHLVTNRDVLELCTDFVSAKPDALVVMISSRTRPPLRLARLHAMGKVIDVTLDDLRFDEDQIARLLSQVVGPLDPVVTRRVLGATEGWAAIVSLVARIGGSDAGIVQLLDRGLASERWIADFAVSELVDAQPAELRQFMLETAILPEFNVELCDVVRNRTDGQRHVMALERKELLVRLDENRSWWRHHHLTGELLRDRAALELGNVATLHARAAAWFSSHDRYRHALEHAIAARRFDLAIANVVPALVRLQVPAGRETYWLDELPDGELLDQPDVLGEIALYVRLIGPRRQRERLDDLLDRARERIGVPMGGRDDPHPVTIDWKRALETDVPLLLDNVGRFDPRQIPELWHLFWPALHSLGLFATGAVDRAIDAAAAGLRTSAPVLERSLTGFLSVWHHHLGDRASADRLIAGYDGTSWPVLGEWTIEWARGLRALRRSDAAVAHDHFGKALRFVPETLWLGALVRIDRAAASAPLISPTGAHAEFAGILRWLDALDDPGKLREHLQRVAAEVGLGPIETDPARREARDRGLSDRELGVFTLLDRDRTITQIGRDLYISTNTVKSHVRSIYAKLGLRDRGEARVLIRSWRRGS